MITITGRYMDIPPGEYEIGCERDNDVETRQFVITESRLFDLEFTLDIQKANGTKGVALLEKTVEEDKIILTWTILEEHLHPGILSIQIRTLDDRLRWHTLPGEVYVNDSINATDAFPSPLPSEFEQVERRIRSMKNKVAQKAAEVERDRAEVATNAEDVRQKTGMVADLVNGFDGHVAEQINAFDANAAEKIETVNTKAEEAAGSAARAKTSEDNAGESETAALEAMRTAVQAMQDLLAMLGTDVATLVDGKVPVTQIPLEATHDTIEITDESELITLTPEQVQRNDVAAIIEGAGTDKTLVKSFKLLGDGDPSKRENWVRIAVEYASISAYATTAGTAENSNRINGHRVVYMTQEQHDNAVTDPETVYMVGD